MKRVNTHLSRSTERKVITIANSKKSLILGTLAFGGALAFGITSASADTYTVKSGDTLNQIAQKYSTTSEKIASDNNIENINLIYVDDTLKINEDLPSTSTATSQEVVSQKVEPVTQPITQPETSNGSVHDQFIAAGGTEAMWTNVVLPESGGNPDITSPNGYHGLGQTKQSWGHGSVESQTAGMLAYANSRYGSVSNAITYRIANNAW